ncbi:hypothetical protein PLICRDRAFT_83516, partial [Plicaturopsis crispa FD-325 SS-3]
NRTTSMSIIVAPSHQGKGYGTEVTKWVLEQAFMRLGVHRVTLGAAAGNVGGRRVYEKAGFRLEGVHKKAGWREGAWWDAISMCVRVSMW